MMIKASIIFLLVGIIIFLSSFISFKRKKKISYTKTNLKKQLKILKNNKLLNSLIQEESQSNKKILNKMEFIFQCRQAEKIHRSLMFKGVNSTFDKKEYDNFTENSVNASRELLKNIFISQVGIFIIALILGVSIKIYFGKMSLNESLNGININKKTDYGISINNADMINNFVSDDYIPYIQNKDRNGLKEYIYNFVKQNKLDIDQEAIFRLVDLYETSYTNSHLYLKDLLSIILVSILSTLIVNLFITVRFKIYTLKLLSEFKSLELLALLHMNRGELNVYEILLELNKNSIYLKPYLRRCLNRYNSNPQQALDKLIKEVNNESFKNFITVLKACLDKSKNINSDILKLQRKLRYLNDELEDNSSIQFKELWLTIAQFPLILMFVVNLLMPFMEQINVNMFS